jgi:peptidoglycan/LPS O-acetylase OafA/YrhL
VEPLIGFIITIVLAVLSYEFIEKTFINMKSKRILRKLKVIISNLLLHLVILKRNPVTTSFLKTGKDNYKIKSLQEQE